MLTFFSDTDCDITPKECAAYNIKLISMPYNVGDQVTYPYIDFDEFDALYKKSLTDRWKGKASHYCSI